MILVRISYVLAYRSVDGSFSDKGKRRLEAWLTARKVSGENKHLFVYKVIKGFLPLVFAANCGHWVSISCNLSESYTYCWRTPLRVQMLSSETVVERVVTHFGACTEHLSTSSRIESSIRCLFQMLA